MEELWRCSDAFAGIIDAFGEDKVPQLCGVASGEDKQNIGETHKMFAEIKPTLFSLFIQIPCFKGNITEWKEDCFEL